MPLKQSTFHISLEILNNQTFPDIDELMLNIAFLKDEFLWKTD